MNSSLGLILAWLVRAVDRSFRKSLRTEVKEEKKGTWCSPRFVLVWTEEGDRTVNANGWHLEHGVGLRN
jgi:hypothetical protein